MAEEVEVGGEVTMDIGEVAEVVGLMMGTGEGEGEEEGLREEVEVGEGGTGRTGVEAGTGVRGDKETKLTATTLEGQEIILSSGEGEGGEVEEEAEVVVVVVKTEEKEEEDHRVRRR